MKECASPALLHIRYLADERIGAGWNDRREDQPKPWATALGALTLHRWGVEKDDAEAARWYRKAADGKIADAAYRLGLMFESGQGVDQSLNQARRWYEQAAKGGSKAAQDRLILLQKDPQ